MKYFLQIGTGCDQSPLSVQIMDASPWSWCPGQQANCTKAPALYRRLRFLEPRSRSIRRPLFGGVGWGHVISANKSLITFIIKTSENIWICKKMWNFQSVEKIETLKKSNITNSCTSFIFNLYSIFYLRWYVHSWMITLYFETKSLPMITLSIEHVFFFFFIIRSLHTRNLYVRTLSYNFIVNCSQNWNSKFVYSNNRNV